MGLCMMSCQSLFSFHFSLFSMKMRKLQKNLKLPALWTWFETVAELAFLIAPKVSEWREPF